MLKQIECVGAHERGGSCEVRVISSVDAGRLERAINTHTHTHTFDSAAADDFNLNMKKHF